MTTERIRFEGDDRAAKITSLSDFRRACELGPLVADGVHPEWIEPLATFVTSLASVMGTQVYPSLNSLAWKSDETFLDRTPQGRALRELVMAELAAIAPALGNRRMVGWAMLNANGSEHPRHNRAGDAIASGVYYVRAGSPMIPTVFEVGWSSARAQRMGDPIEITQSEVAVSPLPGRLALFPGTCWHRMPRYDGTEPRITIAFDVLESGRRAAVAV